MAITSEQWQRWHGDAEWMQRLRLFYFCADVEVVEQRRKDAIARREYWLAAQKEAGAARNGELAKFCKGEAQEAMKEYRGACLVLGHLLCDPPGDSPFRRTEDWPDELMPYARMAAA